MTKLAYREWKARVAELQSALVAAPGHLDLAQQYWDLISGRFGFDVRDGKRLIATFRKCALKSDGGLGVLIQAFRDLLHDTGELPRVELFDAPLENLIRLAARGSDNALNDDAAWILSFLDDAT